MTLINAAESRASRCYRSYSQSLDLDLALELDLALDLARASLYL